MKKTIFFALSVLLSFVAAAQNELPVRGLAIAAPDRENVDRFVKFINEELGPRTINTLILRVDYNYQYKTLVRRSIPSPTLCVCLPKGDYVLEMNDRLRRSCHQVYANAPK